MTVTSITGVAVVLRPQPSTTLSTPITRPSAASATSSTDSVEISQQAVAEARTLTPSSRTEVLLNKLDTDGDGVVSKTEFIRGPQTLLKPGSVTFYHLGASEATAVRQYTLASKLPLPKV